MKGVIRYVVGVVAAVAGVGLACTALQAQSTARTINDGVYTAAQATRGKAQYDARCASCHGGALTGADVAPPLVGTRFLDNWKGQTVGALVTRTRTTMPFDDPGSLGTAAVADITAYILKMNRYPAGAAELPRDAQRLQAIKIEPNKGA